MNLRNYRTHNFFFPTWCSNPLGNILNLFLWFKIFVWSKPFYFYNLLINFIFIGFWIGDERGPSGQFLWYKSPLDTVLTSMDLQLYIVGCQDFYPLISSFNLRGM